MDKWLANNKINRYSTHGDHKSANVERFNRTLKTLMWKRFTAENTRRWIDMLPEILKKYNITVHNSTGMTPEKASKKENEKVVWKNLYDHVNFMPKSKAKFKIGDIVRVSRWKGIFEKGFHPNWSEQLYRIDDVLLTNPITYRIKDFDDKLIEGTFYEQELQKSKQVEENIFRVEKMLRTRTRNGRKEVLVKWAGYKDPTWEPEKNIIDL